MPRGTRADHPKITCAACQKDNQPQDSLKPEMCMGCAGKIRYADNEASNVGQIHKDMRKAGIPIMLALTLETVLEVLR
jgi:hypothetical protein